MERTFGKVCVVVVGIACVVCITRTETRAGKYGDSKNIGIQRETRLKKISKHRRQGEASWYGPGFWGKRTACGNVYTGKQLTAAHMDLGNKLPCGTRIRVTNMDNGRSVILVVNDTGDFEKHDRVLDVSYAAAQKLGFLSEGTAPVHIEVLP
jgi:rare lipoprotein A